MGFCVAGIGEVLWDVFPTNRRFGGAVANVAFHASQLGAYSYIISAVGDDDDGRKGVDYLKEHGIDVSGIEVVAELPTGTVPVTLDENGVPSYEIKEGVAWENIPWDDSLAAIAQKLDALCFGSLAQRGKVTRDTVYKFIDNLRDDCLKVYDVNLRVNGYSAEIISASLEKTDVLKFSDEELKVVADIAGVDSSLADGEVIKSLIEKYDFYAVLYTLGKDGAYIYIDGEEYHFCPDPIKPVSTVGAGDSFTARTIMGLLNKEKPYDIVKNACEVAAYVCMQEGAMPALLEKFRKEIL